MVCVYTTVRESSDGETIILDLVVGELYIIYIYMWSVKHYFRMISRNKKKTVGELRCSYRPAQPRSFSFRSFTAAVERDHPTDAIDRAGSGMYPKCDTHKIIKEYSEHYYRLVSSKHETRRSKIQPPPQQYTARTRPRWTPQQHTTRIVFVGVFWVFVWFDLGDSRPHANTGLTPVR